MRIGIRLHDTAPGSLAHRLDLARSQGFCCAHLALSKAVEGFRMEEAPHLLTREFAEEVRQAFTEKQMECVLLGCYLQLAQRDEEKAERIAAIYRAHIRFAGWMGAAAVGTETPAGSLAFAEPVPCSEEAYQLFLRRLRPLLREAEEQGVDFAIEPVFCDIISTPARARRLLEDAKSDRLRIILDAVNLLSNEAAADPSPVVEDAIASLGERVVLLHMKDFRVEAGAFRPVSLACGEGSMPYGRLLSFAKERNLPLTLEETRPENAEGCRLLLESIAAGN